MIVMATTTTQLAKVTVDSIPGTPPTETTEQQAQLVDPVSLTASPEEVAHPASDANDDLVATFWEGVLRTFTFHYTDGTSSAGVFVNATRPVVGENVTASSALVGDTINTIDISARRVGNANGTADVGVFRTIPNGNTTIANEFQDPSTVTVSSVGPPIMNFSSHANSTQTRSLGEVNDQSRATELVVDSQSLLNGQQASNLYPKIGSSGTPSSSVLAGVFSTDDGVPQWQPWTLASMPTNGTGATPDYFDESQISGTSVTVCASGCNFTSVQTAIDSLPANGGTVTITDQRTTAAEIVMDSDVKLVFSGTGRLEWTGTSGSAGVGVDDANGITNQNNIIRIKDIDNVQIINATLLETSSAGINGIYVQDSTNVDIHLLNVNLVKGTDSNCVEARSVINLRISGNGQDSIVCQDASRGIEVRTKQTGDVPPDDSTQNVMVERVGAYSFSVEGIIVNRAVDSIIRFNNVSDTGDNIYDTGWNENVVFRDNFAYSPTLSADAGLHTDRARNSWIINNTWVDTYDNSILLCASDYNYVYFNHFFGTRIAGSNNIGIVRCGTDPTTADPWNNRADHTFIRYNDFHRPVSNGIFISNEASPDHSDVCIENNAFSGFIAQDLIQNDGPAGTLTCNTNNVQTGDDNDVWYIYPSQTGGSARSVEYAMTTSEVLEDGESSAASADVKVADGILTVDGAFRTATFAAVGGGGTTTLNNPTEDGSLRTNSATGTSCGVDYPNFVKDAATPTDARIHTPDSDLSQSCKMVYIEWSLVSLPDDATITSVRFDYEVVTPVSARNCDYVPLTTAPSTTSNASLLWIQATTNTPYVNNNASCLTAGQNKQLDLGATAASDVESSLTTDDIFAIAVKHDNMVRDATAGHETSIRTEDAGTGVPPPSLVIVYTTPVGGDSGILVYDTAEVKQWGNTEMTLYVKISTNQPSSTEEIKFGTRNAVHDILANYPDATSCFEAGYVGVIGFNGEVTFRKGFVKHSTPENGYSIDKPAPTLDLGSGIGTNWQGYKFVARNELSDGVVNVQIWKDIGVVGAADNSTAGGKANGGNWVPYLTYYDIGGWTNPSLPDLSGCGYANDEIFTANNLTSFFRFAGLDETISLKNISVREIAPTQTIDHIFWQAEASEITPSGAVLNNHTSFGGPYTIQVGDYIGLDSVGATSTQYAIAYSIDDALSLLPQAYPFDGGHTVADSVGTDYHYAFAIPITVSYPGALANDDSDATFWQSGAIDGTGENIYGDMLTAKKVTQVRVYKPTLGFIPATVNVYVTNSTGNWGTAVASNVALTQALGIQSINTTDKVGRYVKLEVNTYGAADTIRISEFDVEVEIVATESTPFIFLHKEFGTMNVSSLSTSFVTIRNDIPDTYTIEEGDVIGIRYDPTGLTSGDYVEIMTDTNAANPFDGTNSMLALSNATDFWTYNNNDDLTADFILINVTDNGYIYADLGQSRLVSKLTIYKTDVNALPNTVDIYVTNNLGDFGTPVKNDHALVQSAGFETIDITNTNGRYVKIEVEDIGTDDSIQLSEVEVEIIQTVTVSVAGDLDPWEQAIYLLMNSFFVVLSIVVIGVVVLILKFMR